MLARNGYFWPDNFELVHNVFYDSVAQNFEPTMFGSMLVGLNYFWPFAL